jgi:hypothetical protein
MLVILAHHGNDKPRANWHGLSASRGEHSRRAAVNRFACYRRHNPIAKYHNFKLLWQTLSRHDA